MRRAIGLVFLVAAGCSPQEELKPDPGVSPFYPGPSADAKAPGAAPSPRADADRAAAGGAPDAEGPLRPDDVEKQLRVALRAGEKGDLDRAQAILDRILALEPIHREALGGRAAVELSRAMRASKPEDRLAAAERAGKYVSTLRRAYERPNQREAELMSKVNYEEVKANVGQGHLDRAVAIVKQVHLNGFDPFVAIDRDPELAKLRSFKGYQDLVKGIEAENLARARVRIKDQFSQTPDFAFDFNLKDLDGKPLSLAQLRGKVVLVDFWGTWCKPCREAIPGLARLYVKNHNRGLEVIGLDYEQNAPDEETARKYVQQVVKEAGIPYPIAMGDDATREKVPNLQAFPTTLLIDRAGKVRLLLTGGGADAESTIEAGVEVLLAEPEPRGASAREATKPRPESRTKDQAPAPPAAAKGATGPR